MACSLPLRPHAVILADEAAGFFMGAIIPIHLPPYLLSGPAEEHGLAGERPAVSRPRRVRCRTPTLIKWTDE